MKFRGASADAPTYKEGLLAVDETHAGFASIIEAARAGGEWAWRDLYRDAAPRVLRYLRARGVTDADDVLGDVFVRVVRSLDGFEGERNDFHAWVITIAHRLVIDRARARTRRKEDIADRDVLEEAAPGGDAENDALHRLDAIRLRDAIDKLTPDQRDVILLRVLGGLTSEETARALGKKPGAVKALQVRALASLRRLLSPEAVSL